MLGVAAVRLGPNAAPRRWRIAALASGLTATVVMVVVGCTGVTDGAPVADTADARSYRSWVVESLSQSAVAASERESSFRESATAEAVADACEMFSSTSVDTVTAINAYVNAVSTGDTADVDARAQAAVDSLNRGADLVASSLGTALLPQLADAFRVWVEATRAVAKAVAQRYGQHEFNAEVDRFNQANGNALNTCGG